MKKEILVFLPDNYADWEGAYICSELNKPETGFIVKTLAVEYVPVKSMRSKGGASLEMRFMD